MFVQGIIRMHNSLLCSLKIVRQMERPQGMALCHTTQQYRYSKIEHINTTYMVVSSTAGTPPRRNTRRMCKRLDALETVEKICSSHLRLLWIVKPNTLWERTVSSAWPSINKGNNWWDLGTSGTMESLAGSHYIDQLFTTTREVLLELAYSSA